MPNIGERPSWMISFNVFSRILTEGSRLITYLLENYVEEPDQGKRYAIISLINHLRLVNSALEASESGFLASQGPDNLGDYPVDLQTNPLIGLSEIASIYGEFSGQSESDTEK